MQCTSDGSDSMLELVIGSIAGTLGVSGFGYQLFKMIKSKETRAMTYPMMAFLGIGIGMWAMYGMAQNDPVIYATNVIMTGILVGMAVCKVIEEKNSPLILLKGPSTAHIH